MWFHYKLKCLKGTSSIPKIVTVIAMDISMAYAVAREHGYTAVSLA